MSPDDSVILVRSLCNRNSAKLHFFMGRQDEIALAISQRVMLTNYGYTVTLHPRMDGVRSLEMLTNYGHTSTLHPRIDRVRSLEMLTNYGYTSTLHPRRRYLLQNPPTAKVSEGFIYYWADLLHDTRINKNKLKKKKISKQKEEKSGHRLE